MRNVCYGFLFLFATTSCQLNASQGTTSSSTTALANSKEQPQDPSRCGFNITAASPEDRSQFLAQIQGVWRDSLKPVTLENGAIYQEAIVIDSLEAGSIAIARASLQPTDNFNLDSEAFTISGHEILEQATRAEVGTVIEDGFRVVQARHSEGCVTYAMLVSTTSRGQLLFVRGPIRTPLGQSQRGSVESAIRSLRDGTQIYGR